MSKKISEKVIDEALWNITLHTSKCSAGDLTLSVEIGKEFRVVHTREVGERYSSRCKYRKMNDYVTVIIPRGWRVANIQGVITAHRVNANFRDAIMVYTLAFAHRGKMKIPDKWYKEWLYRGSHEGASLTKERVIERVNFYRRERIAAHRTAKLRDNELLEKAQRIWVTPQKLRKCGACISGIESGTRKVEWLLKAIPGSVGAVNAKYLLESDNYVLRIWAERVVRYEIADNMVRN